MKTINLTCDNCGEHFNKQLKEYNRRIKKGKNKFYCRQSCATLHENVLHPKTKEITQKCLFCKHEFKSSTRKSGLKCCSKICARRYATSFVDAGRRSEIMTRLHKDGKMKSPPRPQLPLEARKCCMCENTFLIKPYGKKQTCSKTCYHKLISKNSIANPNCGGETNYRRYKYNGITMDSSWEVELAAWLDANRVAWERDRKKHIFWWKDTATDKKRRYYPDFYLPKYNVYLDPKNKYLQYKDKNKLETVARENDIKILSGYLNDIKKSVEILWSVSSVD